MTARLDLLVAGAREWIAGDPDPATRAELGALADARDEAALAERLGAPLAFGTAGLRGVVGAGPARMNLAVVIRTSRAVAEHLLAEGGGRAPGPVVIGFDGRHSSEAFARAAVRTFAAAGLPVRYFDAAVPTPVVARAALVLGAAAAIVVTASHNPAEYNGYKLYGPSGVQITPPTDAAVERRIAAVGPAAAIPLAPGPWGEGEGDVAKVPAALVDGYVADVVALRPGGAADRSLRIVYTPMHGVGGRIALSVLARAGFGDVLAVAEQAEPDGDFPTARFPNPEDPAVLALALRDAARVRADLVLANDPDADRLAACVPDGAGGYVPLTGNQVGVLLGDFLMEVSPKAPPPLVVTTVVSSPLLADVARARGVRCETTLTGFKWIWSAALALQQAEGLRFAFGYEEAIGYSVGPLVRDKDGISAALVLAELAARCRAEGTTLLERLRALYARHGLWVSRQRSIARGTVEEARALAAAADRLAGSPPAAVHGIPVTRVTDYRTGADARPPWLGEALLVELALGDRGRVLVRPSGTEPKLKLYVDLRGEVASTLEVAAREAALVREADAVTAELAGLLDAWAR